MAMNSVVGQAFLITTSISAIGGFILLYAHFEPQDLGLRKEVERIQSFVQIDRKPASHFENTVERPLFSAARRRPPPISRAPDPVELPIVQVPIQIPTMEYALNGIAISPKHRKALLSLEGGDAFWVAEGDMTPEGWMLEKVDNRDVVLQIADVRTSLALRQGF